MKLLGLPELKVEVIINDDVLDSNAAFVRELNKMHQCMRQAYMSLVGSGNFRAANPACAAMIQIVGGFEQLEAILTPQQVIQGPGGPPPNPRIMRN